MAKGECETGRPWLVPVLVWLRSYVDRPEVGCRTGADKKIPLA